MKNQIAQALGIAQTLLKNQSAKPVIDQAAFDKAAADFNQKLQENAMMAGMCTNILLDRLEYLSSVGIIWAKELKRFGNLFREQLAKTEKMIWKNIENHEQQDNFFLSAAHIDRQLSKINSFSSEQLFTLCTAIDEISNNDILQVQDEQEFINLKEGKALKEQIIAYVQSKPKITQIETLQYLRSL